MKNVLPPLFLAVAFPLAAQTPFLVKDINTTYASQPQSSSPTSFARFGNRVYFSATTPKEGTELWSTDGTPAGTTLVSDIVAGAGASNPGPIVSVNGVALFQARDANHGV